MKKEKAQSASYMKNDAVQNHIVAITSKIADLEKRCIVLQEHYEKLIEKAEKKKDITYVVEANALKRKSTETQKK